MKYVVNSFGKNPFLFLLLVGAVLSCVARVLLYDPLYGSVAAIIICLFCLVAYYEVVKRGNAELHNPDNCYYMGLLFTLVSLIYSLITLFLFNSDTDDVAERTYNLIGSFGIALISTFAGILLRILLLQRPDETPLLPDGLSGQLSGKTPYSEPDRPFGQAPGKTPRPDERMGNLWLQAHADLTEAAFKLRMELTQTIADMGVFRNAIVQAANETVQEVGKAQTAMTRQMEKTADKQTEILSTLSVAAVAKLTEAVDGVVASFQDARKASTAMTQQVEKVADEQTAILSTLSATAIAKLTETVDEITASAGNIKKPLNDLGASQARLARSIDDTSERITDGGENLAASIASVQEPLQDIAHNLESTNRGAQAIFSNYDSLHSKMQQSITFFTGIERTMEQSAKTLNVAVEEFSRSLAETSKIAPQYTQQFQEMITVLRGEAEQWQSMTGEVRTSLTQAVEKLTEAIKGSS